MPTSKNRTSLGRGLESLLPENFDDTLLLSSSDKIEHIPVNNLIPNRYQPRKEFDESAIRELASSIERYGILQPLVVARDNGNNFAIIAGERRWRAAKLAGLDRVPAVVRSAQELEQLEIALIENVQRVDLSPLEQGLSIEYLHEHLGVTYEAIAERLGKATSTVHNIVRLLHLPDRATEALRKHEISEGHARAILALKGQQDKQEDLLNNIISRGWSVRQAEQYVVSVREGFREKSATHERMRAETPATKRLSKKIGAKVSIKRMAKGGKLEIVFKNDSQLDNIMKMLN